MKRIVACVLGFVVIGASAIALPRILAKPTEPPKAVAPAPALQAKIQTGDAFPTMATPQKLRIPTLHITSDVHAVGTTADGAMDIPDSLTDAGWYEQSVNPGNPGKAVLAAHTGYPKKPSQFRELEHITPGTAIEVEDTSGVVAHFSVIQIARYHPDKAPLQTIFGASPTARLNIVTCTGAWDTAKNSYTERLVVYAARTR